MNPQRLQKQSRGEGGGSIMRYIRYVDMHRKKKTFLTFLSSGVGIGRWPIKTPTALQSILWPIIDPILVTFGDKVTKFNRDSSYYF